MGRKRDVFRKRNDVESRAYVYLPHKIWEKEGVGALVANNQFFDASTITTTATGFPFSIDSTFLVDASNNGHGSCPIRSESDG